MIRDRITLPPLRPGCTGYFHLEDTPRMVKHYLRHTKPCPVPGHN